MVRIIPILLAIVFFTLSPRVIDGDTIAVGPLKVRFYCIDAPEKSQPFGKEATDHLESLLRGDVRLVPISIGKYGRLVSRVYVGNTDINLQMVKDGYAWVYPKYCTDPEYYSAQAEAKRFKRGLWKQSNPIPPWEWRHGREGR